MPRSTWDQLPSTIQTAVMKQTGSIETVTNVTGGTKSAIAVRLLTAKAGFFVKGVRLSDPQAHTQKREAEINPYLPASSPRIVWHVEADDWSLIGFQLLNARHADFRPGSPDLHLIVDALTEMANTPCPDLPLSGVDQRWAEFAPASALPHFKGTHLLHTDLSPDNVLIDRRAHVVDWAWAARGPAWVDAAIWIARLIDAGHTPHQAEQWGNCLASWRNAFPTDATSFAHANAALWDDIAKHDSNDWKTRIARSARIWSEYRATQ